MQRTIQIADAKKAPQFLKSTAEFLMNTKKSGLKLRQGVFNGKRVDYFKAIATREDSAKVINELGKHGFILRVNRGDPMGGNKGAPRALQPNQEQEVRDDGYYMWIYEGSQVKLYAGAALLVAVVLAAVLFPLWPESLRLGVWYLSVGVLGLLGVFFGIAIIRLILYIITIIIMPRGIWLFPNLFEDVGIIESFIPLWGWDEPKSKKKAVLNEPAVAQAAPAPDVATSTAVEKQD
ncbi:translocation protein Sec62-domain-containing protein [Dichotomocladium elegans]|nr:translocation protein Sec62-domain-containing protein [Dichotomocladium elegans]